MSTAYSEAYLQRFGGTARLYGQQALAVFAQAHVCVIGIGGVGSWAAEALARTGIGAITLIDMDDVCVTNTNRQIHALRQHVGQSKTEVMAERILAINPECRVTCIDDFITPDNVAELLDHNFSYVIDAIDSVRPKAALLSYCRRFKIPVVTTGGAGGQIDPTKIEVADLAKTIQDPLAAKLRERLKHDFNVVKTARASWASTASSPASRWFTRSRTVRCALHAARRKGRKEWIAARGRRGDHGHRYFRLRRRVARAEKMVAKAARQA